jgi:hypothetical protein
VNRLKRRAWIYGNGRSGNAYEKNLSEKLKGREKGPTRTPPLIEEGAPIKNK